MPATWEFTTKCVSLFQSPCKPYTEDRLVRLKRIFSMIRIMLYMSRLRKIQYK
uniref:Uncharacterized protein n=1 Tax=Solanum tuberosum TaxID=4113 RepID=M1A200_SOLTU